MDCLDRRIIRRSRSNIDDFYKHENIYTLKISSANSNSRARCFKFEADLTCTESRRHRIIYHSSYSHIDGFCSEVMQNVCVAMKNQGKKVPSVSSYSPLEFCTSDAILPHSDGGLPLVGKIKNEFSEELRNITLNPERDFEMRKTRTDVYSRMERFGDSNLLYFIKSSVKPYSKHDINRNWQNQCGYHRRPHQEAVTKPPSKRKWYLWSIKQCWNINWKSFEFLLKLLLEHFPLTAATASCPESTLPKFV